VPAALKSCSLKMGQESEKGRGRLQKDKHIVFPTRLLVHQRMNANGNSTK
jgi:hypothetical protein